MHQNEGEEPSIIGWQRLKEQFFFIMHAQIWMIREPLSTLRHEINSAEAAAAVASIASLYPHKRGIYVLSQSECSSKRPGALKMISLLENKLEARAKRNKRIQYTPGAD
jgi:hypothetical protein